MFINVLVIIRVNEKSQTTTKSVRNNLLWLNALIIKVYQTSKRMKLVPLLTVVCLTDAFLKNALKNAVLFKNRWINNDLSCLIVLLSLITRKVFEIF